MTVRNADLVDVPNDADIVTLRVAVTFKCVTEKVPDVIPAGIVTEVATLAVAILELFSITFAPAEPAGADNVMFPTTTVLEEPTTDEGLTVIDKIVMGSTVSRHVLLKFP